MIDPEQSARLRAQDAAVSAAERRMAEAMGVVNAAHGALIEVVAEVADADLWCGPGLASLEQYVALKTGLAIGRARDLTLAATRRNELPTVIAGITNGELTLDQVGVIARHVPAGYGQAVAEFARSATVSQLQRALPRYGFEPDPAPEPKPGEPAPAPAEPERTVSMATDEHGRWHGRFCLPAHEGALFERAVRAHRDDLHRQHNAELPPGVDPVRVSNADALLSVAEAAIASGEARFPGADRYVTHLHLEAGPTAGGPGALSMHWGPVLPDAMRRHLLCDATFIPVLERDGVPVSAGRKTRAISRALRRSVEHRDGGCAVPGCGQRLGTEIHHIRHWEDGGPTDTANLLCLCRRHHQLHHQGLIGIEGNADLPAGTTGAVVCTDRWNRTIRPVTPTPPAAGTTPTRAARDLGLHPTPYPQRHGERLDTGQLHLAPDVGSPQHRHLLQRYAQAQAHVDAQRQTQVAAQAAAVQRRQHPQDQPHPTRGDLTHATTDPTRAGPAFR